MAGSPGHELYFIKDERDPGTWNIVEHGDSPQYCCVFKTMIVSKVAELALGEPVSSGKSLFVEFRHHWAKKQTASRLCRPEEVFPDYLQFFASLPHRRDIRTNGQHPLPVGTLVLAGNGRFRILGKILAVQSRSKYSVLPLRCQAVQNDPFEALYDDVEQLYQGSALKKTRLEGDWVLPIKAGEKVVKKDIAESLLDSIEVRSSNGPVQYGHTAPPMASNLRQTSNGSGIQVSTRGGLMQPLPSSASGALLYNPPHSAGVVHGGRPYNHTVGEGPAAVSSGMRPANHTPGRPLLPTPSQAASLPSSQNSPGPMLRGEPHHPPDATRSSSQGVNYGSLVALRNVDSHRSVPGAAATQSLVVTHPQAPQHLGYSAATTSSTAFTGGASLNGSSSAHDLSLGSAVSSFPMPNQNFSAAIIPASNTHAFPTTHGLPNMPRMHIAPSEVIDLTQDSPVRPRAAPQDEEATQAGSRSENREAQMSEEFPIPEEATAQESGEAQEGTQGQKCKRNDSDGPPVPKQTARPKANDTQVGDMEMDETQVNDTQMDDMQVDDMQVDDPQTVETTQKPKDKGKRKISEEDPMPVQAAPDQAGNAEVPTQGQKDKGKSRANQPVKTKKTNTKADASNSEDHKYQVFPDPLNIRRPQCPNCSAVFCHCGLKKQWCKCVCWACGGRWKN